MKRYGVVLVMLLGIMMGFSACTLFEIEKSPPPPPQPVAAKPVNPYEKYLATIPPEVLEQYDPVVIDDAQRKTVIITQSMIWQLRDGLPSGGHVYQFDLEPLQLSTVQKEIIRRWILDGHSVLLWGAHDVETYAHLFTDMLTVGTADPAERPRLALHPVNTDVHALDFLTSRDGDQEAPWLYRCLTTYPPTTEIVASVDAGALAGKFPFGKGTVYFASLGDTWPRGSDKDRWELNFRQWMLGKPIPKAAVTHVRASSSPVASKHFVRQVKPAYPALAVQQGWEGTVTLTMAHKPDGTIGEIKITESSGYPVLDDAAQHAMRRRRAAPPTSTDGTAATRWTQQRIHFRLQAGNYGDGMVVLPTEQTAPAYVEITGKRVNIRTAPHLSAAVVAQAMSGDIFMQHGKEGTWYKISLFSGELRYVHTAFAKKTPSLVSVPPNVLTRREIFNAHVEAEARAKTNVNLASAEAKALIADSAEDKRAVYEALLTDRYRLEVAHQFGIRVPEYRLIVAEGVQKGW